MDLRAWGIDEGFHDTGGRWHPAPPDAVDAVASAMDAGADGPPPSPLWIVRAGERHHLPGPAEIVTEDGRVIPVDGGLPADLPLGYHELHGSGPSLPLVVAPWRCYRPATLRVWGWAIQLYAVRSAQSWGMGDLTDLRDLARWSARDVGAGVVLLNPLSAARPGVPQQPSPYFPSSRRFRNPLYLRVEEIPGAGALGLELDRIASAGRALNASRPIDRDEILGLKILALEQLYAGFSGDPRFDEFCADHGDALTVFATFNTLVEEHGQAWRAWPVEHRHPARREVGELAEARADRVRFHRWLQWQLDRQLGAASDEIALMHDLPVGIDPDGADAWQWQDVIAADARMGAPPDDFNERGQDWGLAPFDPWKLRRASYRPFIETIRAGFRHAGALRLDHVMGLFRLFWIPAGHGPADGVYVRYPADDLLDLLALESARAGAYVVGEDLGTVEPGVRDTLVARGLLSYRLVWFEDAPPEEFPPDVCAAVTTHDLPTIAGMWTGADAEVQRSIGVPAPEEGARLMHERLRRVGGVGADAPVREVIDAVYARLTRSPAAVVLAPLEDALGVTERPNQPGTVDEWPNWRLALPAPLEQLTADPQVRSLAATLGVRGRSAG